MNHVNSSGSSKPVSNKFDNTTNRSPQESSMSSKKKNTKRDSIETTSGFSFGVSKSKTREIRKQRQARKDKRDSAFRDQMFSASWNPDYATQIRKDNMRRRRERRKRRIQPFLEDIEIGIRNDRSNPDPGT